MVTRNTINIPTGASGTILQGQGTGSAEAFSTATYPLSTTSQQILYSTANNIVGELTTANSALPATNSSGTLAMRFWQENIQIITATGTYTPTTGMVYCVVKILGGGGAGAGINPPSSASQCGGGGGGGAGEYAVGVFSASTIGASQSVTIGAAGTGVAGGNGNPGTATSFGALMSANGGLGGIAGATGAAYNTAGGLGGTGGTGGSFRVPGQAGTEGCGSVRNANQEFFIRSGNGGNTQMGAGGFLNFPIARGYGSGGGSAFMGPNSVGSPGAGGIGADGVVVVTEYIIN